MTAPAIPEHGLTPESLGVSASQDDIDRAVDAVRGYCGWHVWPSRTETLIVDGEGGHVLALPTLHVTSVGSITENGVELGGDDYEWSASGDVKRLTRSWTTRWRGVAVELAHGYTECPFSALVGAMAGEIGNVAEFGPITEVGPFKFGTTSGSAAQAILPYRGTLNLYRLPSLP